MGIRGYSILLLLLLPFFGYSQNKQDKIIYWNGKKFYFHIVKKGESLYGLSKDYNVSVRDLILENPRANEGITQGDTLNIPFNAGIVNTISEDKTDTTHSKGKFIYHKVEPKETLYSLSKRYNTTMTVIDSLNPGLKENGLKKDQIIRIPVPGEISSVKQDKPIIKDVKEKPKDTIVVQPINSSPDKGNNEKEAYKKLVIEQSGAARTGTGGHDSIVIPPEKSRLLKKYKVALIFPFCSAVFDTMRISRLMDGATDVPYPTLISANFYQGFRLAMDSLSHKGLKVDLYVYNVNLENDSSGKKFDSLLKNPDLATMNLIIGPPNATLFHKIARYADDRHIPAVSPLSDRGVNLKGMPMASKVTPSPFTEMEQMADYLSLYYKRANIIIVHHRDDTGKSYYRTFKTRLKSAMLVFSNHDSVYECEYSGNINEIIRKADSKKLNLMVFPDQSTSIVAKFVNELANSSLAERDSIILFGMHGWITNDVLDMANLDTLHFHFPSNDFINYKDTTVKTFIHKYRSQYYADPDYYACQGFDIGWFYLTMLGKYGMALQDHLNEIRYKGVHTSFELFRPDALSGYENKAVYILEYKNYVEVKDAF